MLTFTWLRPYSSRRTTPSSIRSVLRAWASSVWSAFPRQSRTPCSTQRADVSGSFRLGRTSYCKEGRAVNEVRALVEAFDVAIMRGERCALAMVVSVEGSSYRRPGARLLVCEGGTSTGAISAGCLESDVIEHAKHVIVTSVAKIIEYNTASTSDEMAR